MSKRAQRTSKYMFATLAQLSENFIFIYLGLSLFTQTDLVYKPIFIIVTTVCAICLLPAMTIGFFKVLTCLNYYIIRSLHVQLGGWQSSRSPNSSTLVSEQEDKEVKNYHSLTK